MPRFTSRLLPTCRRSSLESTTCGPAATDNFRHDVPALRRCRWAELVYQEPACSAFMRATDAIRPHYDLPWEGCPSSRPSTARDHRNGRRADDVSGLLLSSQHGLRAAPVRDRNPNHERALIVTGALMVSCASVGVPGRSRSGRLRRAQLLLKLTLFVEDIANQFMAVNEVVVTQLTEEGVDGLPPPIHRIFSAQRDLAAVWPVRAAAEDADASAVSCTHQ